MARQYRAPHSARRRQYRTWRRKRVGDSGAGTSLAGCGPVPHASNASSPYALVQPYALAQYQTRAQGPSIKTPITISRW
eukprot:250592-Rhodomonas_salina.1